MYQRKRVENRFANAYYGNMEKGSEDEVRWKARWSVESICSTHCYCTNKNVPLPVCAVHTAACRRSRDANAMQRHGQLWRAKWKRINCAVFTCLCLNSVSTGDSCLNCLSKSLVYVMRCVSQPTAKRIFNADQTNRCSNA